MIMSSGRNKAISGNTASSMTPKIMSRKKGSAAMVMRRLFEVASAARTEVVVCGLSGSVARTLRTLDILRGIAQDRLTGTLDEARTVASELLNERPAAG